MFRRILLLVGIGALAVLIFGRVFGSQTQPGLDLTDYRATMIRLLGGVSETRTGGNPVLFGRVAASGDPLYIAPLIDLAYFVRTGEAASEIFDALALLTGQELGENWQAYFTWASEQNIALPPSYAEFKGLMLSTLIDPEFARFFQPGVMDTARINLLEPVWGGVRVDGIPSLVNARQISPQDALAEGERLQQFCRADDCTYPAADEYVFGVSINGDNRAYPLRLLNWHEMFNDVIGRAPLVDQPNGEVTCQFRAPLPFRALARQGDDWVQILGTSAGCPEAGGWLADPAGLKWGSSNWEAVRALLPDSSAAAPLSADAGISGQVAGMPVMLAYCTLCGSGILYDATIPDLVVDGISQGKTVLEFGSTGLLMRSNKLMYDRKTDTVWNAMTGEPAFGPLAASDIRLEILPVVVIDWASWLAQHPDTSVLSLETGYERDYTNGGAYGDYFNNPDFIMFPVWQQDTSSQDNKEVVFTLYLNETPKAYPLRLILPEGVTNDTLAGQPLVLVSQPAPERDFFEPGGAAVRAYQRGSHTFRQGDQPDQVVDEAGFVWAVTEDALRSPDGDTLARLGGHLAFWFGWYSFYPDTLVYEPLSE